MMHSSNEARSPALRGLAGELALRLSAQDWLLAGYFGTLLLEVIGGSGPRRLTAIVALVADILVFGAALWLVRAGRIRDRRVSGLVYRLGLFGSFLGSFFQLQWILPAASGPALDAKLHRLDLRIFGIEPAQAFDRFVCPETTEWFSFFYYGYFVLLAAYLLPILFLARSERVLLPFGFGIAWLYSVGHVVYTLVPAYGPYAHLTFEHPLSGSTWWPLVEATVASVDGSARTDVFPSLHTAGPAFLAMFAFKHRTQRPFRQIWALLVFVATQIILATMFLRWHYLVDVVAGLALATSGIIAGRLALRWDEARQAAGGPPSWPALR
jgi:hypothetical protein